MRPVDENSADTDFMLAFRPSCLLLKGFAVMKRAWEEIIDGLRGSLMVNQPKGPWLKGSVLEQSKNYGFCDLHPKSLKASMEGPDGAFIIYLRSFVSDSLHYRISTSVKGMGVVLGGMERSSIPIAKGV